MEGRLEPRLTGDGSGEDHAPALTCSVTLGKLFNLSEPWFPHLLNGDKNMPQGYSEH